MVSGCVFIWHIVSVLAVLIQSLKHGIQILRIGIFQTAVEVKDVTASGYTVSFRGNSRLETDRLPLMQVLASFALENASGYIIAQKNILFTDCHTIL